MYFLTIRASLSHSTMVPRALRTNFAVRLIMPCRLPWAATFTLPVPVILKRFLAPLLVFNLGILFSFLLGPYRTVGGAGTPLGWRSRHDRRRPRLWNLLRRCGPFLI